MSNLPEKLLHLILNSPTLQTRLSGEGVEVFLSRVFDLSDNKQQELMTIFEQEAETFKKIQESRGTMVEDFYKKLKAVKVEAGSFIRRAAEQQSVAGEAQTMENLLADL